MHRHASLLLLVSAASAAPQPLALGDGLASIEAVVFERKP